MRMEVAPSVVTLSMEAARPGRASEKSSHGFVPFCRLID